MKILISAPENFLQQMNKLAEYELRSRSELIREAVRYYSETFYKKEIDSWE